MGYTRHVHQRYIFNQNQAPIVPRVYAPIYVPFQQIKTFQYSPQQIPQAKSLSRSLSSEKLAKSQSSGDFSEPERLTCLGILNEWNRKIAQTKGLPCFGKQQSIKAPYF